MYKIEKNDIPGLVILVLFAAISFFIIKNFVVLLAFTVILTYMYYPAYKKIDGILKNHAFTSLISILFLFCVIIIPTVFAVLEFSNEFSTIQYAGESSNQGNFISDIGNKIGVDLTIEYNKAVVEFGNYVRSLLYDQLPQVIFSIIVMMFFFYYFLKHYEEGEKSLKNLMGGNVFNRWEKKIKKLLNGIIYGQMITRLLQSAIAIVLFLIIGVKGAIVWGLLIFFAAFIPIVGTSLIWAPLIFLNLMQQNYILSFLILLSGIIISVSDNFILPHLISEKTKIGPITTLISILGGISLFGIYGLILGPFSLGIFLIILKEFIAKMEERYPNMKRHTWSELEREKYYKIKNEKEKKEFKKKLDKKYGDN